MPMFLRVLVRHRSVSLTAAIVLALGIGANTAIFSVVDAVVLRELPYESPGELVSLRVDLTDVGATDVGLSGAEYVDVRDGAESLSALSTYGYASINLTNGGEPVRVTGAPVNAAFWPLMGIAPLLGQTFDDRHDRPGAEPVVVLSERLWRRSFGAERAVIGRRIALNGERFTVLAVMPDSFRFPSYAELWTPAAFDARALGEEERSSHYLGAVGRLKEGRSLASAQTEVRQIVRRMRAAHPANYESGGYTIALLELRERVIGDARRGLLLVSGAVGLVLLIACANVANLLLARAMERRKEMAVRIALGATRARLVGQLLTESVVLAMLGGAAGVLVAMWAIRAMRALAPAILPRLDTVGIDGRVLAFTLAVSIATGVLFGLWPALQASGASVHDTLKDGGRGMTAGGRRSRVRRALVVAEVALTLVLLAASGLLLKSFGRLQRVDPGFLADSLLTFRVALAGDRYSDRAATTRFYEQLLERARVLPGVRSVGATTALPVSGDGWDVSFDVEGRSGDAARGNTQYRSVAGSYHAAMGVPIVSGRPLQPTDTDASPYVALVNETFARRYFGGESPLGKRIRLPRLGARDSLHVREIVGVVRDVRHFGLDAAVTPEMYVPHAQQPRGGMTVVVRTSVSPASLSGAIRREVRMLDPGLPVHELRTMGEVLGASTAPRRLNVMLVGVFAASALLLTVVGVYGVISYSVAQRSHEIGVRVALGAGWRDVFALVVGEGLSLAAAGIALGSLVGVGATRLLDGLLFEVRPDDPTVFGAVAALLAIVAVVASLVPARRALRVNPVEALREDG